MNCPHCKSVDTRRRGGRNGSQRFSCNDCEKWYNDKYHERRDIEPGMVLKVKWKDDLRVHGLTDIHVGASEFHREKFNEAGIQFYFQNFKHPEYNQMHGEFIPNMSFIDLLFNYGDESINVLPKSSGDMI